MLVWPALEEMATLTETAYGKLLSQTRPRVIKTERENQRALAELEALDNLDRRLTREEEALAELLTLLVRQFEEPRYPLGHAEPLDALPNFMEVRHLRQRDLIPIFGASSVVSDVLNGKHAISKTHARKLAEFFHAPISLFI
jgi:HTH-type transcriptional regulator/antitoxin HigA